MNISLIGMPASGKTTIAKALKNILNNYTLIDTDEKIVNNEKMPITEIFQTKGEKYFRSVETKVLKEILKYDNQIISTGGGIIKSDENIKLLKGHSTVIYLSTELETLVERAVKNTQRPLLNNCDIKEKLKKLLIEREEKYKQAHYVIKTEGKTPKEEAEEIAEKINENGRSKN